MKILGLEKYELTELSLKESYADSIINGTLYFKYNKGDSVLINMTPKERGRLICQQLRNDFKKVIKEPSLSDWAIIGTKFKPRGLKGSITAQKIFTLECKDLVDRFFIDTIEELESIQERKTEKYFSVVGLFAAFVEGYDYSNSIQVTEERTLLVKAIDIKVAERKALVEFKKYAQHSYLNEEYRYVRWKLIEVIDIYETDVEEIDPNGTEVYSIWKRKKIKTAANKPS